MRLRQEQVVAIAALALIALLVYRGMSAEDLTGGGSRSRPSKPPEFVQYPAPDTTRALPREGRAPDGMERPLFEPPRDTRPLPQLELEPPPLLPLAAVRPPAAHGPAPRHYGRLLRVSQGGEPETVDGLFDELVAEEADLQMFEALGGSEVDEKNLTPEERMERIASFRRLYDWIKTPGYHWGQIRNADRFGLAERDAEPIEFIEIDPATGSPRFPGQAHVPIARDRVDEFGFAETIENEIELKRREFAGALTPGKYHAVLAFADWCTTKRLEAGNALGVAEEMYQKARDVSSGDPSAWLGLARCYEAGFRFEQAFGVYRQLVDGAYSEDPVVLAHLARLEDRFRMFAQSRKHYETAERYGRNEWTVSWSYGRHLLERGEIDAAIERLLRAARQEPTTPELGSVRARIRTDLGNAYFANGDPENAASWYAKALQADLEAQDALAGIVSVAYIAGPDQLNGEAGRLDQLDTEGAGFELLLARGLMALAEADFATAREELELAAEVDPLRGYLAWRALSYLAEVAGHPDEAYRLIELAYENDPTDCYTLIRRGEVLAARDDLQGALANFTKALDKELELPDVLAAMGRIEFQIGNHERAELFLERSLFLDEKVAGVHTLRGLNQLALNQARAAEESFSRARNLDRTDPVAKNGLAWCAYVLGDPVEAQTLFRELDDERRTQPEDDPHRVYALAQIERIADHQEKVVWSDGFERQEIANNWSIEGEDTGVNIVAKDGTAVLEGTFTKVGRTRLKREYNSSDFVSVETKVTIEPGTRVRVGMSVSLETYRRGEWEVSSEVSLSRHQDGMLQTRFLRSGKDDSDYADVEGFPWNVGEEVVLRLERYGESTETSFRLEVDGIAVLDDVPVPTMGRSSGTLWVSLFVEGEPGRPVTAVFDDVEIVKRER